VGELEIALGRLAAGEPWLVQVVGEPGIGKSRLLSELAGRAGSRGYLVLSGRAAEFERDVPFGLLVEALNDYLGAIEATFLRSLDAATADELAWIFPALGDLGAESRPGRLASERYRAQYAIRTLLERFAARQPLVLLLDDVHWADGASIEVIAHLSRRFRGPLLCVLAFRRAPARLARALDSAARSGFGSRLELPPLNFDEAEALIGPGFDAATNARLYRESGGNPFYLEQLVRGTDPRHDRGPRWGEAPPAPGTLPAAVAGAIRDEVETLDPEVRLVLDAAAIAGESFELELVAAIAEVSSPLDALDALLRADLIRPTDAPRRFRFRHPIVRRAVYDEMGRGWQLGAHARAAATLAAAGAPASARAHHVDRSAIPGDEESIALLIDAARAAAPRAPLSAGRWLRSAVALLAPAADRKRRIGLLGEAGAAFAAAGSYEDSLACMEEALALVPRTDARRRAELSVEIAWIKQHGVRRFESQALLIKAHRSLPPDTPAALTVRLELAYDHWWRGEFDRTRDLAAAVAAAAGRPCPRTILARALVSLASFYESQLEDALRELAVAEQALATVPDERVAERMDLPAQMAVAAYRLERFEQAREHVRRGARISRQTGQSSMMPMLHRIESNALLMQGQLGEAIRAGQLATEAAHLLGNDRLAMWALEGDAMAAWWVGDTDRAVVTAREAVASAERAAEPFFSGLSRIQLAAALLAGGEAAATRSELVALDTDRTRRLLDLSAAHGWTVLTEAHVALGEVDDAAEVAVRAQARAQAAPLPQQMAGARLAYAVAALAKGDADGAVTAGQDAALRFDRAGNPLLAARARVLIGAGLAAAGERQAALDELTSADAFLSACGARQHAAVAARELRRLGRRVAKRRQPTPSSGGSDDLSARELEVAHHVTMGETNREIAAALFLSEKTIESHLARIYGKLGVHSRTALAAALGRNGWLMGSRSSGGSDRPGSRGARE
jgi:ATP/maltotriose-dependent transcriptional regulator MalT